MPLPRVDYYTVTFYDGQMAYSDDTLQRQQTLLKGYPAVRPVDPVKEGVVFREWVTGAQEEEAFDFNREIQEKTAIYAAWKVKEPEEPDNKPEEPEVPTRPDNKPEKPDNKPEEPEMPTEPDAPEEGDMPEGLGRSEVSDKPTDGGRDEPKTGDAFHVEVYATFAMIAGMLYLLLYFADQERGMTEETKKELVSALVNISRMEMGKERRASAQICSHCGNLLSVVLLPQYREIPCFAEIFRKGLTVYEGPD